MIPEGRTNNLQPNRLVLEAAHRLAVDRFGSLAGYRLSLRPSRRFLFAEPPTVQNLAVELRKPAFAALIAQGDPDARVHLVIETDNVSPGIRALYRAAKVPYVHLRVLPAMADLYYETDGISIEYKTAPDHLDYAVHSILEHAESSFNPARTGSLLRNTLQKTLHSALTSLTEEMDYSVHLQMPFGYAVGYRPDMPGAIARQTIEMVIGRNPMTTEAAEVVLPIRVESRPIEERDEETRAMDEQVAAFVVRSGIPMVAVEPATREGSYSVTCSMDGVDEAVIEESDIQGWSRYFEGVLSELRDHLTFGNGQGSGNEG
ncbi:MAG: hypothetical protein D6724_02490 [Armatimonadetes bacterium]|nr:MAG: hypothetical protein D6724_02490 [Armatimonadota bacterium]